MTVSNSLSDYAHSLGAKHVSLIYNGIDFGEFEVDSAETTQSIRQQCGWPEDSYVLTFVGRLVWQKGLDYLLPAVQQAVKKQPNLRCLLVGDGKRRIELEAQAAQLGLTSHVHFMGYQDQVSPILAQSDFFCLSSRSEGLPYALLEACAHRLPLLLSDVDGMGELFTHDETAYLTPVGGVAEIAEGINWLITHGEEARQLGENAYAFVQQQLNPEQMTAETLTMYGVQIAEKP